MTAPSIAGRRGNPLMRRLRSFATAVSAVGTKELRGRMRGRRAFAVVTVYLLLLSAFAFGIYVYNKQAATLGTGAGPIIGPGPDVPGAIGMAGLSATIGHALFSGLLLVETLLILVLAPAFTSGAISLEREKQTLDLLVTTPLSTFGMVVGKLFSALTYVFLLIIASIPLASLVFVFGGVGPEDLVRGYVLLFALAFGMGALGLLISALVKRTQTATVMTYIVVLALTLGSFGLHQFLIVATQAVPSGSLIITQQRHKAPEALLWLNPFVADVDLVCATAPGAYHDSCRYMSQVTGRPYFGSPMTPVPTPGFGVGEDGACPPGVACREPAPQPRGVVLGAVTPTFGFPRDTFWPKSAAAFAVLGLFSTVLAAQLVAPTRRLRWRRPLRRTAVAPAGTTIEQSETESLRPEVSRPTEMVSDEP
jgi:ABC-type transport system involved in multi-copper enzyme maturation permease subunit